MLGGVIVFVFVSTWALASVATRKRRRPARPNSSRARPLEYDDRD
jgi:hypothetical protein